jgi:hypothetical protein
VLGCMRRSDKPNELGCEPCQGVGGVCRPRVGIGVARFSRLRSPSSCNRARSHLWSPSNTTLISKSSPLTLSLRIAFTTNVKSKDCRTKLLAMFTFDAAGSLSMCTIFDEDDTKGTAGGLVYLRLEYKNLTVRRKVPSDLFLWCQWGVVGNQDQHRGGAPAEFQ